MKKLVSLSLAVGIGFLLGALSLALSLPAQAGSVGPTATRNGDTNGDDRIDVSDAVYLLNWLFAGGQDIAQIKCPDSAPKSCLLATGQTECFGSASLIDCTVTKARGQDAYYKLGCPLEGRFVDHGDGTVSDTCTGLMWTKRRVDVDADGEITAMDVKPWLEACQIAQDMTYLGHDDWRVPNVNELLSIVNFGQYYASGAPLFDVFEMTGSIESGTWTSTHDRTGYALSHRLSSGGFSCECCVITRVNVLEAHPFLAVRGP